MRKALRESVAKAIREFQEDIEPELSDWYEARTPVGFRTTEMEVAAQCRRLQDAVIAALLVAMLSDSSFEAEAYAAARQTRELRYGERRPKTVRLLGGGKVRLAELLYIKPNNRGQARNKKRKRRGKDGGLYPALSALGIEFGVTPALGSEVVRQVVDSDSVRAGRSSLARRDIDLGHEKTLDIVNAFSARAVEQRNQWLEDARNSAQRSDLFKGKRVVISTDGGRTRHRSYRGKRRKANGHRNYNAEWREPKLIIIYIVNARGKVEAEFRPICDGTYGDCSAIFEMLLGYLRALGVRNAKELIIVADGAKWIWERVDDLIKGCEISAKKVSQVVDWYHALEKLNTIAGIPKDWSDDNKAKWIRKAKRLLFAGHTDRLAEHIDSLATGRRAKKVHSHQDYFVRNSARMQYTRFVDKSIPIGSGAMESAIRRVVNLRMKSNAKFWLEHNAEGMLMLRAYLKVGRYDDLINWSISSAAPWWVPQQDLSLVS